MGDIADWINSLGYVDGWIGRRTRTYRSDVKCNRCDSRTVKWKAVNDQWLLVNKVDGARHRCPFIPENEFDEVLE